MPQSRDPEAAAQPAYRIGAAARLSGLSSHTLRKWEDRYGVVTPRRSAGGERLYSAADVKRLVLVKELAHRGMPLADLAARTSEELEGLLRDSHESPLERDAGGAGARVSLVAIGAALPVLLAQEATAMRRTEVLACGETLDALTRAANGVRADVLLLECPAVTDGTARELADAMSALDVPAALVIYGFGSRTDLDALRRPDVALLRAPVGVSEIERLCLGLAVSMWEHWPTPTARQAPGPEGAPIAPRRFSRDALARVGGMASSIACECPRHLADILLGLDSFEDYSARCESRDDKDRALHHYLRVTTATSRRLFEDALARVAAHEGLELD